MSTIHEKSSFFSQSPPQSKGECEKLEKGSETATHKLAQEKICHVLNCIDNLAGESLLKKAREIRLLAHEDLKTDLGLTAKLHQIYDKAGELLIEDQEYEEAFKAHIDLEKSVVFTEEHPLFKMHTEIAKRCAMQKNPLFGAHFSGLGRGIVKGGNLRADCRIIDGKKWVCFSFKISQYARKDLNSALDAIRKNQKLFEKKLPENLKTQIVIEDTEFSFKQEDNGEFSSSKERKIFKPQAISIKFIGSGSLIIGSSPENGCLYHTVMAQIDGSLDDEKGLKTLYSMLATLGLGSVLMPQNEEDDTRMKVAQLFRTYFPSEANPWESGKAFYEVPVDSLVQQIEEYVPEMHDIFDKYFYKEPAKLEKQEIYPGKTIWTVTDLGDQMKQNGAIGLMMGVSGDNPQDTSPKIKAMVQQGAACSWDRCYSGLTNTTGASTFMDICQGSGDYVFTRLIHKNTLDVPIRKFDRSGKMQMLLDLELVNRGSYGYRFDNFGVKNPAAPSYSYYKERMNLIDLTSSLTPEDLSNEIMIKSYVPPKFISGVTVDSEAAKKTLIECLGGAGLINNGAVLTKPVDQFIHITDVFKREFW